MDTNDNVLPAFLMELEQLLCRPFEDKPAELPSEWFAAGQAPDLFVYVGGADEPQWRQLRRQLPNRSILLVLHGEPGTTLAAPPGRSMAGCLQAGARWPEKIGLLLAALPERNVRLVVASGYRERVGDLIAQIEENIRLTLDNIQQDRNRGLIRLRSSLRNLPSIVNNLGLKLHTGGRPPDAVICGAGPSLCSQLAALKDIQDRVIMIAVGHAAPVLLQHGITPRVVVEVDSHAGRNWPAHTHVGALLVACTEVAPEVAACFDDIYWSLGSSPAFNLLCHAWGLELPQLQLGRTATVPAMDVAVRLGCRRIALVGQDLCLGAAGVSHADGEVAAPDDPVEELPGNETPTVRSTAVFAALRETIQIYLRFLNGSFPAGQGPVVYNCTAGGARIEGATPMGFAAFCEELAASPSPPVLYRKEPAPAAVGARAEKLYQALREFSGLAGQALELVENLRQTMAQPPVNTMRARSLQAALQQVVAQEEARRRDENSAAVLQALGPHADGLIRETAALRPDSNSPFDQLDVLEARYQYLQHLAGEFAREAFHAAQGQPWKPGVAGEALPAPLDFKSFREFNLHGLAHGNRALAAALRKSPPPGPRFKIRWANQFVPYVLRQVDSGAWVPLSSFTSMFQQAQTWISQFVNGTGYNEKQHGVIMAGAGNWAWVTEFARRYPRAHLLVVEHWPELLGAMLGHGCFLHLLPRDTCVVAPGTAWNAWPDVLQHKLAAWRAQGLQPVLWEHPLAPRIPELKNLAETLRPMIERGAPA